MIDISEIGHSVAIPYDLVNDGKVTNKSWPTDQLIIIKLRDGSFTLGANIRYQNQQGTETIETRKVLLTDEGTPFVSILAGHDFTKDNCDSDIISQKHINGDLAHVVSGSPVLTVTNGQIDTTSSVFSFTEESKSVKYFSSYGNSASLNQHGLSLITKFVEHPESKALIEERTAVTTPAEIEFLSKEMKTRFDKFLTGKIDSREMGDLCKSFEELSNKCHMDENTLNCSLTQIEEFFRKEERAKFKAAHPELAEEEETEEFDDEIEELNEEVEEDDQFDDAEESYEEDDEFEIENEDEPEDFDEESEIPEEINEDDEFEEDGEGYEDEDNEFEEDGEDYEDENDEFEEDGEGYEDEDSEFEEDGEGYEDEDNEFEEDGEEYEDEDSEFEEDGEAYEDDEAEENDEDLEEDEEQPSDKFEKYKNRFGDRFKNAFMDDYDDQQ